MRSVVRLATCVLWLLVAGVAGAEQAWDPTAPGPQPGDANLTAPQKAVVEKLRALTWIRGPQQVPVSGNSTLHVPEGYVFLQAADTAKFMELNQNPSDGKTVMVAPRDLGWTAYLEFEDTGYIKDDEKIDADALLKSLKEGTESSNALRQQRGWQPIHVVDWASRPRYNTQTRRLEWATLLQSDGGQGVNYFTKVLGRHGTTSVILVVDPVDLGSAERSLNALLDGYAFNAGERYAEWKEGDKVAEYGLAALILGGAAAVATKKGVWAVLGGFIAAGWKLLVASAVAVSAAVRRFFKRRPSA
jgi:uncharacterized membrane-anchored protein